jgi:hypothetical protein
MTFDDISSSQFSLGIRGKIFEEFHALIAAHEAHGPFLEIGAPSPDASLLTDDRFAGEERYAVGPHETVEQDGLSYRNGNPNDLTKLFQDGQISTVLWNGGIARDKHFWRTLAEVRRVLKPGGVFIVVAQAFAQKPRFGVRVVGAQGNEIANATIVARAQAAVADYWRISPQAMRQIVLEDFEVKEVRIAYVVPRVFGVGVKKG